MVSSSVVYLVILCSLASFESGGGTHPSNTCVKVPEDADSTSLAGTSNHPYRLMCTGNDHFRVCDFKKALACYDKAIELQNDEAKFYRNRGLSHEKLNMMKEALADHEEALKLDPYNVRGQFNLGRLLFELKKYQEAVDHLRKALDYADAHYMTNYESHQIETMLEDCHQKIDRKSREEDLLLYFRSLIVQDAQRKIMQTREQKHTDTSDEAIQYQIKRYELDREYYLDELEFALAVDHWTPMASPSVPKYFRDRTCNDIIREPVITPSGVSYEKAQIEKHLKTQHTDSMSSEELLLDQLRTNKALKTAIEDFMEKNGLTYRVIEENAL